MACHGNGSINDKFNDPDPELLATIRAALIVDFSPRKVARKLGLPKSLVSRARFSLMKHDATFQSEVAKYQSQIAIEALDAQRDAIKIASRIARKKEAEDKVRLAACNILINAPAAVRRATAVDPQTTETDDAQTGVVVLPVPDDDG